MPNGHGVPLGCIVCRQTQKDKRISHTRHCERHNIEVDMDLICSDFENAVNEVQQTDPKEEGILYAYVEVEGHGYPPPVEFVPFASIAEYRDWDEKQRRQGWREAQEVANKQYNERK